jgi:hypothetical protein
MTITITPPTDKLITAYNNSIIEFISSLPDTTHAILTNNFNTYSIKLSPNSLNTIRFNIGDINKYVFNIVDNVPISLGATPNITFRDTDIQKEIVYTITVYNATTSDQFNVVVNLMRYVIQDLHEYQSADFHGISPVRYTYFKGFPFDIQFYANVNYQDGVVNRTGSVYEGLNFTKGANRIYIDNGLSNEAIIDIGHDQTELITYTPKTVDCDGVYLKWLSSDGSWRYWLFNVKHKETIKSKSIGKLFNDWFEPLRSQSPSIEIGRTAEKTMKLHATGLEPYERDNIATLITSPKVYLYKGKKGELATLEKFYEVELSTNSFVINEYDKNRFNTEIEILMREQTIAMI